MQQQYTKKAAQPQARGTISSIDPCFFASRHAHRLRSDCLPSFLLLLPPRPLSPISRSHAYLSPDAACLSALSGAGGRTTIVTTNAKRATTATATKVCSINRAGCCRFPAFTHLPLPLSHSFAVFGWRSSSGQCLLASTSKTPHNTRPCFVSIDVVQMASILPPARKAEVARYWCYGRRDYPSGSAPTLLDGVLRTVGTASYH